MGKKGPAGKRMEKGKKSLREMMDFLRPYLPKPDVSRPEPARDWKSSDVLAAGEEKKEAVG